MVPCLRSSSRRSVRISTSHLIGTGAKQCIEPFRGGEVLHAPCLGREGESEHLKVGDEAPVGEDHSVESEFLTQQARDNTVVEAERDFLDGLSIQLQSRGQTVVRHDRACSCIDGSTERGEVFLELVSRVDLFSAIWEMRILAVLLGSASGKVLRCAGNAVRTYFLTLKAPEVRRDHGTDGTGVLPERLGLTGPSRFGCKINLRVQGSPDPDGQILTTHNVTEFLNEFRVTDGGQAEWFGPLGHGARGQRHPRRRRTHDEGRWRR